MKINDDCMPNLWSKVIVTLFYRNVNMFFSQTIFFYVRFLARTGLIKLQYFVFICLHHIAFRNDKQIKAETKLAMVRC